jgi:signal transduction histidine kinase
VELEEIRQSLKGHIQDIRHLIHDLRPLAVDQLGLRGALEQLLDRFAGDTGIETLSDLTYDEQLDPLTEVTVFRVVQECLSNVQKHAGATRVEVHIRRAKADIGVAVRDNGRGFAPQRGSGQTTSEGVGLVSMRERAELVGGCLSVRSSPGKGCQVSMLIPQQEQWVGTGTDTAV